MFFSESPVSPARWLLSLATSIRLPLRVRPVSSLFPAGRPPHPHALSSIHSHNNNPHVIPLKAFEHPRLPALKYSTNLSVGRAEGHGEVGHGAEDGHQGLHRVAIDHRLVLLVVLRRETRFVDNSEGCLFCSATVRAGSLHLFDNGRLPRFSCPQK